MTALPIDVLGEGPDAVLILHGAFGSRESWIGVAPGLLRAGLRVVTADLPGHGHSALRASTTLDGVVEDIVATAVALRAERLVIVGHSMGGTLLGAAERRLLLEPGLNSAVYVDAPFSADAHDEPVAVLEERVAARVAQRTPENLRARHPQLAQSVVDAEARAARDVKPRALAQLFADATGRALLPSFGCPSLLVLAGRDSLVGPEEVELAEASGAQLRVVAGAGHGVYEDEPVAFQSVVTAWLDEVLPRR